MRILITTLLLVAVITTNAQTERRITPQEYIDTYKNIAIKKMQEHGIPASITLAQGMLESGNGNSMLTKNANNHFGIKCHGWDGPGYYMDDDAEDECFRKYKKAEQSFEDHSTFLTTRARYKFIFDDCQVTDYKCWAKGLKKAGYATNPKYADLLITIIERNNLQQYDNATYQEEETIFAETDYNEYDTNNELTGKLNDDGTFIFNRIKTTVAETNNVFDVALKHNIPLNRLYKYNDMTENNTIAEGQKIYLQPKRKKGAVKTHVVGKLETLWEISQEHGIKLKKLRKKNKLAINEQPVEGTVLMLKKKTKTKPNTRTYLDILDEKNKIKQAEEAKKLADLEAKKQAQIQQAQAAAYKAQLEAEKAKQQAEQAKLQAQNAKQEAENAKQEAETAKQQLKETQVAININSKPTTPANENKPQPIINESKPAVAKYHTVQPGETLYALSNKYYIAVEDIIAFNNLQSNSLNVGQRLIVGYEKNKNQVVEPPKKQAPIVYEELEKEKEKYNNTPAKNNTDYHTVQQGESLYGISKQYGLSVYQLLEINNLDNYNLSIGQELLVKPSSAPQEPAKTSKTAQFHTVQAGETLYSISKKYKVSVDNLKNWNKLADTNLSVGQKIQVSK